MSPHAKRIWVTFIVVSLEQRIPFGSSTETSVLDLPLFAICIKQVPTIGADQIPSWTSALVKHAFIRGLSTYRLRLRTSNELSEQRTNFPRSSDHASMAIQDIPPKFWTVFHPRPSSDIIRLSVLKLQAKVPTTKLCWLLPGLRTSLRFHSFRERNIDIACHLLWKLFALHIPMPRQGFSLVSESYTVVVWTVRRQFMQSSCRTKKGHRICIHSGVSLFKARAEAFRKSGSQYPALEFQRYVLCTSIACLCRKCTKQKQNDDVASKEINNMQSTY